jgi:arylsulfatase A-like enzyme
MSNQFPSLVIVVFDAARAQNFGLYGYRVQTTPFLSSLAEKTASYKNAICSSYWTLPSFASMFTGTYVSRHGLIIEGHKLKSELTTLAEYLSRCGYDTAGFCQNPYVSNFTGLDRGFEHFEKNIPRKYSGLIKFVKKIMHPLSSRRVNASSSQQTENKINQADSTDIYNRKQWLTKCFLDKGASDMNRRAVTWLKDRTNHRRPFFLVLLYGDTHAPYCPPLPYRTKFLRDHKPVTRPLRSINQERTPFNTGQISMNEKDIAGLRALYDGSIAYSDHCVKMIILFSLSRLIMETISGNTVCCHMFTVYMTH